MDKIETKSDEKPQTEVETKDDLAKKVSKKPGKKSKEGKVKKPSKKRAASKTEKKDESALEKIKGGEEGIEGLVKILEDGDFETKDLINEQLTPEKKDESVLEKIEVGGEGIEGLVERSEDGDVETKDLINEQLTPEKKDESALEKIKGGEEGIEGLVKILEDGDFETKDLINEQLTPEKEAVFQLSEEKFLSDMEVRIKKLRERQTQDFEEKPQKVFDKMKKFLTRDTENVETYDRALHGPLINFDGIEGYNEVERYWVNEPYAFVVILINPEKSSYVYYVAEPELSGFEDLLLREIKDRLKDVLIFESVNSDEDKEKILTSKVICLVKDYAIDISPLTLEKILYYTRRDFIKFGKIDPLMHDNRIEDISSNGFDIPIYLYHKKYTNVPTNIFFAESELDSYVIRLAQRCGKHVSVAEPMVDATMSDGSRIQMTLGTEVTTHGATFTIRKFSEVPITPVDLINWNTFSAEEMAYLWLCIENNKSLIYAGGTASGKTSSLNAVSLFIPWQAKIITLEDTRELKLPHPNWIPGVTRDSFTADGKGRIDMYDLLRAALRQRPEFLLVGEVRGKEALTLFQAMSTGHTTFSTMHADSVSSAIHRLENPPISVPRSMIQALNIMSIQAQTYVNGKRARRNMKLVEITDIDPTTRNIRTNDIFAWDALTDKFNRVGESKALNEIMIRRGWNIVDLKKELSNRQKILEFMVNNKISDFNAIATIIHDYQVTPDKVLKKLNISG
jgi:flagellar protein FlaI